MAHFALFEPVPATVGFVPAKIQEERDPTEDLHVRLWRLDKNGSLSGDETGDEIGEQFRSRIARVDENQNGIATRQEIVAFISKQARRGPENDRKSSNTPQNDASQRASQILEQHDTDKDGKLSGAETPEHMSRYRECIDTNKDGFIEKSDLELEFRRTTAMSCVRSAEYTAFNRPIPPERNGNDHHSRRSASLPF